MHLNLIKFLFCLVILLGCGESIQLAGPPMEASAKQALSQAPRHIEGWARLRAKLLDSSGEPMENQTIRLSRSISGRATNYEWNAKTGEFGRIPGVARIDVTSDDRVGATGYYQATVDGLGTWGSIPLQDGKSRGVILQEGSKRWVASPREEEEIRLIALNWLLERVGPDPFYCIAVDRERDPSGEILSSLVSESDLIVDSQCDGSERGVFDISGRQGSRLILVGIAWLSPVEAEVQATQSFGSHGQGWILRFAKGVAGWRLAQVDEGEVT